MAKEGIGDLSVVDQSLQSLDVSGEDEGEAEKQSLFSIATDSRFLEGQPMAAMAAQLQQLSEAQKILERNLVADACLRSEHQQPEQQQGSPPRHGEEQQPRWGDDWEQDSWNSIRGNQRNTWDQDWSTEAASSSQENIASTFTTCPGWGPLPGETESTPYVDPGYFDQEILILGKLLTVRVAYTAEGVEDWIRQYSVEDRVFGIDIEWRPNHFRGEDNQAALVQIAGKHGCMIVQLLYIDHIPEALKELLADPKVKLAGVGVRADTKKLFHDYGLVCRGEVDLGLRAADVLSRKELKRAGLSNLCELVLGIPFKKAKSLTMSNWAIEGLSLPQISYAASDACIAYSLLVFLNEKSKERLPAKPPRSFTGAPRSSTRSSRSSAGSPRSSAGSPPSSAGSAPSSAGSPPSTARSPPSASPSLS